MAPHRRHSPLARLVLVTAGLLSAALLACAPTPSPVDDARHPDPPRPPLVVPTAPGPTPPPLDGGPPAGADEQRGAFGAFLDSEPEGLALLKRFSGWLGGAELRVGHTYLPGDLWSNIEGAPGLPRRAGPSGGRPRSDRMFVLNVPHAGAQRGRRPRRARSAGCCGRARPATFDQHFRVLAERLVELGVPDTVIVLGWEMNGTTYTHRCGPDPEAWKEYWRRIVTTMRSVPGQKFKFDFAPNRGAGRRFRGRSAIPATTSSTSSAWTPTTSRPDCRSTSRCRSRTGSRSTSTSRKAHGKPISYPGMGSLPQRRQPRSTCGACSPGSTSTSRCTTRSPTTARTACGSARTNPRVLRPYRAVLSGRIRCRCRHRPGPDAGPGRRPRRPPCRCDTGAAARATAAEATGDAGHARPAARMHAGAPWRTGRRDRRTADVPAARTEGTPYRLILCSAPSCAAPSWPRAGPPDVAGDRPPAAAPCAGRASSKRWLCDRLGAPVVLVRLVAAQQAQDPRPSRPACLGCTRRSSIVATSSLALPQPRVGAVQIAARQPAATAASDRRPPPSPSSRNSVTTASPERTIGPTDRTRCSQNRGRRCSGVTFRPCHCSWCSSSSRRSAVSISSWFTTRRSTPSAASLRILARTRWARAVGSRSTSSSIGSAGSSRHSRVARAGSAGPLPVLVDPLHGAAGPHLAGSRSARCGPRRTARPPGARLALLGRLRRRAGRRGSRRSRRRAAPARAAGAAPASAVRRRPARRRRRTRTSRSRSGRAVRQPPGVQPGVALERCRRRALTVQPSPFLGQRGEGPLVGAQFHRQGAAGRGHASVPRASAAWVGAGTDAGPGPSSRASAAAGPAARGRRAARRRSPPTSEVSRRRRGRRLGGPQRAGQGFEPDARAGLGVFARWVQRAGHRVGDVGGLGRGSTEVAETAIIGASGEVAVLHAVAQLRDRHARRHLGVPEHRELRWRPGRTPARSRARSAGRTSSGRDGDDIARRRVLRRLRHAVRAAGQAAEQRAGRQQPPGRAAASHAGGERP